MAVDEPVTVTPPKRGTGVTAIDLSPRASRLDNRFYEYDLAKAMADKYVQGEAYRTRMNPVLSHLVELHGVKDRGARMTREMKMLRSASMVWTWKAYENTRVRQCSRWWTAPAYRGDAGWRIALSNRRSSPTRAQRKRMEEIEEVLRYGGKRRERPGDHRVAAWDATWTRAGDPLPVLMAKWIRNILTFGHGAIEIERSRKDPVVWMAAMDASMVRMVHQLEEGVDPAVQASPYVPFLRPNLKRPEYVVLDDRDMVNREYGYGELVYTIQNPISDLYSEGYGYSELELVIELLVSVVMGVRYNREAFVDNKIPTGALLMKSISAEQREAFEQIVRDNVGGGPGKWFRLPVLLGEEPTSELQWVGFSNGAERQDMMWKEYLSFVLAALTSVCGIALEELGFQSFVTQQGTLSNPDPYSRIENSQDKGLVPLLELCKGTLNEVVAIIEPSGDYEIDLMAMRPRDAAQESQLRRERLDTYTTVNEERTWEDLPPRRIPINLPLWRKTERIVREGWEAKVPLDELIDGMHEVYYKAGGEYSIVDMLPTNLSQQQIVTQEIGEDLAPQPDPVDQWQSAMNQGPPPEWSERVDMNEWKAAQEKAQQGGQQEEAPEDFGPPDKPKAPPGGGMMLNKALSNTLNRARDDLSREFRIFEVFRR